MSVRSSALTHTTHWVKYFWFVSRASIAVCAQLHRSAAVMGASVEEFNAAKEKLGALKKDPGNEVKLKVYALFKQVRSDP
uniref:ACB domain-containing protein n=1 Tax=Cyprinus carpio TaxID=7962 RepID=A0A8C2FFG5_CYPCA